MYPPRFSQITKPTTHLGHTSPYMLPHNKTHNTPTHNTHKHTRTYTACPSGYSLVRARFNPQADSCVMCTAQFYNIEGSTFSANGTDTVPGFHCKTCPVVGANCPVCVYGYVRIYVYRLVCVYEYRLELLSHVYLCISLSTWSVA